MINTQEQIIIEQIAYKIGGVYLINTKDRGWIAEIMFEKYDPSNQLIGTKVISKTGLDYNNFWENFNSGSYLLELLIQEENLNVSISQEVEQEFVNS